MTLWNNAVKATGSLIPSNAINGSEGNSPVDFNALL